MQSQVVGLVTHRPMGRVQDHLCESCKNLVCNFLILGRHVTLFCINDVNVFVYLIHFCSSTLPSSCSIDDRGVCNPS